MTRNEFMDKWDQCYANHNESDIIELFGSLILAQMNDKELIVKAVRFLGEYPDEEEFLDAIPDEYWMDENFCTEIIATVAEYGNAALTIEHCKNPIGTAEGILTMHDTDRSRFIYDICDEVESNPVFYKQMLRLSTEVGLGFDPYELRDFMEETKKFTRSQISEIIGMPEDELF